MLEITSRANRMLERMPPSALISAMSYDEQDGLYFHEDNCLGYVIRCYPLVSVDDGKIQQLQVLLTQNYPTDTVLQISLWTSPDIEKTVYFMNYLRQQSAGERPQFAQRVASTLVKGRGDYLRRHTSEPLSEFAETRVRDIQIIISAKIPCSGKPPNERDIERALHLKRISVGILTTLGMDPQPLAPEQYIRLLGSMVNWGPHASWRDPALIYDTDRMIREQVFDPESIVRSDQGGLWVGNKRVKTLCVKRMPETVHLYQAASFLGDLRQGQRGVRENVLITLNILFPDAEEARTSASSRRTTATWQSMGPLARYVPALKAQKESFDVLFEALEDGDRVVNAYLSFALFTDDEDHATSATSKMLTYYRELGYRLQEDRFVSVPVFINALPMCAEAKIKRNLMRYKTMAGRHAAQMMPVIGDWKGSGTPVNTLVSRNGQLMTFDLFDSSTNYSAIVAAESGSGKSFFVNFLLNNYMSIGADIYLIEVGRSFKNTCKVLGGDHLEFTPRNELSLNPFSIIENYEEQADLLLAVLLAMISPRGEATELQTATLRAILKDMWDKFGKQLTIDMLAAALREHRTLDGVLDQRINDLGVQLSPFTTEGEYGRWFNGPATINFTKSLTVLELQDLKEKRHLMKVVLVQLMAVIQRAMYLGGAERPKLLIVDEGWDLITSGPEGRFIEQGTRQLRKYKGGAILILQSVNDLYKTEVGEAIAENTATKFLLGQTSEAIESLLKSGRLSLGEGAADVLKGIHTRKNEYSEIFIYSRSGAGIARLTVDRPTLLLYSTDPADKVAVAKRLDGGMSIDEAIQDIIQTEQTPARRRAQASGDHS